MKQASDWNDEISNDPGMASDLIKLIEDIQEDAFKSGVAHCCRRLNNASSIAGKEEQLAIMTDYGIPKNHWFTKSFVALPPDHPNDLA